MRKPNPLILKLMYQAGAYPFDDFDVEGNVVGMWVIPTAGVIPIVLCVSGNGHTVSALQAEIKRLGNVLSYHHNVRKDGVENWTYEIHAECGSGMSRISDRKMVERTPEEIVVMTNSFLFVPWFDPPASMRSAYSGKFDASLVPDPSVTIPSSGLTEVQDWDAMPGPNMPAVNFPSMAGVPGVERPRLNLSQFKPFAQPANDAAKEERGEDLDDLLRALERKREEQGEGDDEDAGGDHEADDDIAEGVPDEDGESEGLSDEDLALLVEESEEEEEEEGPGEEPEPAPDPPKRKRGRPRKNP